MRRTLSALFGTLLTLTASMGSWAADAPGTATPPPSQSASGEPVSSVPPLPPQASIYTGSSYTGPTMGQSPALLSSQLPDLSGPAYKGFSRTDEAQIGRLIMAEAREEHALLEDPEVSDYIQTLGMRLASQAHDDEQSFTYSVIDAPVVNAFATFGGLVFIYSGLILETHSEAELASVVAHETGHVVQRHMARQLLAEQRIGLAAMAGMLAGIILAAAAGKGEAVEGALAMGQSIQMQQTINQIRSQEIEADAVGVQLLAAAGYDPYEMANFFETFSREVGLEAGYIPALLQDHPVFSERVAAARQHAAQMPKVPLHPESISYEFFKERVRVLSLPPEARLAQYYDSIRDRRELTPAERYGEALVQMQSGHAAEAVPTLRDLQAQYPQLIALYSALGQALTAAGRQDEALAQFTRWLRVFPRNVPLTVRYAEALMSANRASQAHEVLLDLFNNVEPTPAQIRLTALAASAAGDSGDAYYYMSLYELAGGQLALANQQLELALAAPDLTNVQRERFKAQLAEVRGWLREQQDSRRRSIGG
jgi:beta-barrel assembly-enhancing protease